MHYQTGILEDIPQHAIFLEFELDSPDGIIKSLEQLNSQIPDIRFILGIGQPALQALAKSISGLSVFPDYSRNNLGIPSTQGALWINIRDSDEDAVRRNAKVLEDVSSPGFRCIRNVPGFKYDIGRDLTGYEDGTENPTGEDAVEAAIVNGAGAGMDGSSFVAVQQWLHDFSAFNAMSQGQQDDAIGRYRESNEEFDAPPSAHVKRTAQEDFDPEAFVLRRSMPWSSDGQSGLVFVAYAKSYYAFDAQMKRMTGADDRIVDALFHFTRPITGSLYWCPPLQKNGSLDLSLLGV